MLAAVFVWGDAAFPAEGADEVVAAVVADLQGDVEHGQGGVPQQLLAVLDADRGEQLGEGAAGGAFDEPRGVLGGIMQALRDAGERHAGCVILNVARDFDGGFGILLLAGGQLAKVHIAAQKQHENFGYDGVDQFVIIGLFFKNLAAELNKRKVQVEIVPGVKQQIVDAGFAVQTAHKKGTQQVISSQDAVEILPEGGTADQHVDDHTLVIDIQRMRYLWLNETKISLVEDGPVFTHLMDAFSFQDDEHFKEIMVMGDGRRVAVVLEDMNALPSVGGKEPVLKVFRRYRIRPFRYQEIIPAHLFAVDA